MNIDEMIFVLTAAKAGKPIQCSVKGENNWFQAGVRWNFATCDYRVKPSPREWTAEVLASGHLCTTFSGFASCGGPLIKVREVL